MFWDKFLLRQDEEAIQKDLTLRNSIIDHLENQYIFWKDKKSVFLGCNKTFALSANLSSPAEIVGKTDYDLPWSKEESDAYTADDRQVMQSGLSKLNIEETQTLPDGTRRILSTSKIPLLDKKGKVYGVLAIYSDVTREKLAEQAKTEFIRNVSHDMRTPLAGIQQVTLALSEGKIPESEIPEIAFSAWEASEKLMTLFNQVIDVSKKGIFDFEDQVVKFDLQDLLESIKETYTVVAKHQGLELTFECSNNTPRYIIGKDVRLHRVLMNLLGNALKFTEKGSVKLIVEKAQEMDNTVVLRFSIIDTGIGIDKQNHRSIFELFSRLNPAYEATYPGSGLGLHIVKEYVEKMAGEIYVESEKGKGSMFTCVLPFKKPILDNDNDVIETDYIKELTTSKVKKNAPVTVKTTATKEKTSNVASNQQHVLLVEDDNSAQRMGSFLLKEKGYIVDIASSGNEALELTAKNKYDVIYMDLGLGAGIDGIETTKRIRTDKKNPNQHTFITALTAHGDGDEKITKQCMDAGMQHVLGKPLQQDKIIEIQTLLAKAKSGEATPVIDFDLWRTRLGDHAAHMLEEMVHMLGQDFDKNRKDIKQAYEAHDLPTLKAVTHKLKGALSYCAVPRLETAMKAIELAAKNGEAAKVDELYPETMAALDEAQAVYKEWEKSHPKKE